MSETTATHLARLRVHYGNCFRIERNGTIFTARERASGRTIIASSPGDLEGKLIEQTSGQLEHKSTRPMGRTLCIPCAWCAGPTRTRRAVGAARRWRSRPECHHG
jgi:hypothetical protein